MLGLDEEGFYKRFREEAIEKVKGGLLLMNLVNRENIKVEDADLTAKYEKMTYGNPDMLKRVTDYYSSNENARQALKSEIEEEKAIAFLLENAVITEVEPEKKQ